MKYETPELTVLTPAISAVQGSLGGKLYHNVPDSIVGDVPETSAAYADWE